MGILDMVQSMAGGAANPDHAKVAGGLIEEMQQRPGGIGGILQSFQQKGMGNTVQQWSQGQTQPADQGQVENALGGTGLIDSIAQRTGLSPTVVKGGLAVALPLIVHHMFQNNHITQTGQPTGTQPEPGGLLKSVLGRLI